METSDKGQEEVIEEHLESDGNVKYTKESLQKALNEVANGSSIIIAHVESFLKKFKKFKKFIKWPSKKGSRSQ
jgi:hypothetical protein